MIVYSVACRAVSASDGTRVSGCGAGWYGTPDEKCPRCGARVAVTGSFASVDLG